MENSRNHFDVQDQEGFTIIKVNESRSSIQVAAELKDLFSELILQQSKRLFLVDLTEVTFVESSFLGAIVFAYKEIMQKKGVIKVIVTNAIVYDRFIITQLDKLFDIFNSREEALNSFN
ncbi:MAG: STAS domain-containing protein [Bacteroidetes bacterium]|nr:STAS domain-containing protein [Bacteroidota bacterium]